MAIDPIAPEDALPDWPPLATDRVSALPEGTTVIAVCPGEQGPRQFTVHRESGRIYAQSPSDVEAGVLDREKVLTFVSPVWLPAS